MAVLEHSIEEKSGRLSLRLKINLIFAALTLVVLGIFVALEIQATRSSVREEMQASNRIATQLLTRIGGIYARDGTAKLAEFLRQTGRVRANEVHLFDDAGQLLYVSPPPTYKAGRDAPAWYAALVTPPVTPKVIPLDGGKMVVTTNPSRAVLDGWDDLKSVLISQAALLLAADILLFWLVGRWLAPLERIQRGLREIERGAHHIRLPALPGKEAGQMGRAFNRMAQAVEDNMKARQAAAEAQARLVAQREFTQMLHRRIEEERSALARELHDEFGQSLTAIRSIAKSIMQHPDIKGRPSERSVQLLFDTAGSTCDAMHRMIPRLRPMQLDEMGLVEAVRDLVSVVQLQHPAIRIDLQFEETIPHLAEVLEISVYRIIQEALTNVIRHAGASQVRVVLNIQQEQLRVTVSDNGIGEPGALARAGHYGVRGMQERAESLGGSICFQTAAQGGLVVDVTIPIQRAAA
jgi:two-component system sensor histidine kinase UhpB